MPCPLDQRELAAALEVARHAAHEAGEILARGYRRRGTVVRKKGTIDLVTEYDVASESRVREIIHGAFPGHAIVGEEQAPQGTGSLTWYIDPLDGTTNYAHGHPFFAVAIALYEEAEPLLAVVHAPILGLTWWTAGDQGAQRSGEPCHVSQVEKLIDALGATGFAYDRSENPDNNVSEFGTVLLRCQGVRRCGAAAIDQAFVADGTYDFYWEKNLCAWDVCAGAALVRAAGGRLTDLDGSPPDPRRGRIVASNGRLHDELLAALQEAGGAAPPRAASGTR